MPQTTLLLFYVFIPAAELRLCDTEAHKMYSKCAGAHCTGTIFSVHLLCMWSYITYLRRISLVIGTGSGQRAGPDLFLCTACLLLYSLLSASI